MRHLHISLAALALFVLAAGLTGCAPSTPEPSQPADSGGTTQTTPADHGEHGEHADLEKVEANLAKLSDEERTAAETQSVCPVSDEKLGSMGVPIKIKLSVKDRDVWICCASCKEILLEDPDKYLAKLKN